MRTVLGFVAGICAANVGWYAPSVMKHGGDTRAIIVLCILGTGCLIASIFVELAFPFSEIKK